MRLLSILKHELAQLRQCWVENHQPTVDNGAPDVQWLHNEATEMFRLNAAAAAHLEPVAERGMNAVRLARYTERSAIRYRVEGAQPVARVENSGQKTLKFTTKKREGK